MFEMILKVITSDIFVLFCLYFKNFSTLVHFYGFFYKNDVELRYWKNEYVHMKE